MFGRKVPKQSDGKPGGTTPTESDRISSYRVDQDAAPPITGGNKTTSYVNAMQINKRGYETIN